MELAHTRIYEKCSLSSSESSHPPRDQGSVVGSPSSLSVKSNNNINNLYGTPGTKCRSMPFSSTYFIWNAQSCLVHHSCIQSHPAYQIHPDSFALFPDLKNIRHPFLNSPATIGMITDTSGKPRVNILTHQNKLGNLHIQAIELRHSDGAYTPHDCIYVSQRDLKERIKDDQKKSLQVQARS